MYCVGVFWGGEVLFWPFWFCFVCFLSCHSQAAFPPSLPLPFSTLPAMGNLMAEHIRPWWCNVPPSVEVLRNVPSGSASCWKVPDWLTQSSSYLLSSWHFSTANKLDREKHSYTAIPKRSSGKLHVKCQSKQEASLVAHIQSNKYMSYARGQAVSAINHGLWEIAQSWHWYPTVELSTGMLPATSKILLTTHLFLHLFNLLDRAPALRPIFMPQQVHTNVPCFVELLLLLLFCFLQFALSADALSMVHVVCFHHLQKENSVSLQHMNIVQTVISFNRQFSFSSCPRVQIYNHY